MARLGRSEGMAICRECLGALLLQVAPSSTPTLPVIDMQKAIEFYKVAGFGVRIYNGEQSAEPDFAFVSFEGHGMFDLELVPHMDPATNGAGCYIIPKDVNEWHARMSAAGLPVTPVQEEPWGMREFTLTDPSGNRLRIGRGAD
ncbi:MAG TPA: VOC family protein [Candidatus Dormibacteraeota bacterium]|nr:VOC family protein [Candidatus Dormibacteraeota bacterium]